MLFRSSLGRIEDPESGSPEYFAGLLDEVRVYDRILSSSEVSALYSGNSVTSGLVGYWQFDEGDGQSVSNSSANGNIGNLGSSMSSEFNDPRWIGKGKFGNAMMFDGEDDFVTVPGSVTGSLDIRDDTITLSGWIYPKKFGGTAPIVSKGIDHYSLRWVYKNKVGFSITTLARNTLQADVPDNWKNNWHLVTGVYDGSNIRLYIDGNEVKSDTLSGDIHHGDYQVNLARNAQAYIRYLNGGLDDVRIYDRALSASEVSDLYQGNTVNSDGLVGRWKFDNPSVEKGEEFLEYSDYIEKNFNINGVVYGDRAPQSEAWQMKYSQAPVQVEPVDLSQGKVKISNYYSFKNLNDFLTGHWELHEDNVVLQSGTLSSSKMDIGPLSSSTLTVPYSEPSDLENGSDYWLNLSFVLASDEPLVSAGHEINTEQFKLPYNPPSPPPLSNIGDSLSVSETSSEVTISGKTQNGNNFTYTFDKNSGTLSSMVFNGKDLILEGPQLDIWAHILQNWGKQAPPTTWTNASLSRLDQHSVSSVDVQELDDYRVEVTVDIFTSGGGDDGFESTFTYTFLSSGDVTVNHSVTPSGHLPSHVPKIGVELEVPRNLGSDISWYGLGPASRGSTSNYPASKYQASSYPGRQNVGVIDVHESNLDDLYEPFPMPQEFGNKMHVRWAALQDNSGTGLMISAEPELNMSFHKYLNVDGSSTAGKAYHQGGLLEADGAIVDVDYRIAGTDVDNKVWIEGENYRYSFALRPFSAGASLMELGTENIKNVQTESETEKTGGTPLWILVLGIVAVAIVISAYLGRGLG